jgi:hypothetical protein
VNIIKKGAPLALSLWLFPLTSLPGYHIWAAGDCRTIVPAYDLPKRQGLKAKSPKKLNSGHDADFGNYGNYGNSMVSI